MLRLLLEAGGDLSIKEEHPLDGDDFQQCKEMRGEKVRELNSSLGQNDCDGIAVTRTRLSSYGGMERRNSASCRSRVSRVCADDVEEEVERMIHMAARVGCAGCLALLIQYGAPVNSRVSATNGL